MDTSINRIYAKHRDPAPTWIKVIGRKFSDDSSANVYSHCRMNFTHDAVLTKSPNFINLGLSSVHTLDELGSIFIPTTRIGRLANVSNWLPSGHLIGEDAVNRVIRNSSEQNYSAKTYFEARRENQYFGRQNNSMSLPALDSTPLGMNMTNGTTSPIDSIPVRTKTPEPTPLTPPKYLPRLPKDLQEKSGKAHVLGDLDPDPSSSDSSSNKSNSSNDSNSSKSIKKKRYEKKNIQKHKKQEASDSSSSDSDSFKDSDYR